MNKLRKIASENDAQIKVEREAIDKELNDKLEIEEKNNQIDTN